MKVYLLFLAAFGVFVNFYHSPAFVFTAARIVFICLLLFSAYRIIFKNTFSQR